MPARTYPQTNVQQGERRRSGWIDVAVAAAIFGLIWVVISLGGDMRVRFDELHQPPLSLDVRMIPYYTARTVLRMFIAFAASLLFTFGYGYVAAKSPAARRVMLPIIDILQSVPVLSFLAITVTGFLALFPGSLLGVECASIFADLHRAGLEHDLRLLPLDGDDSRPSCRKRRACTGSTAGSVSARWNCPPRPSA